MNRAYYKIQAARLAVDNVPVIAWMVFTQTAKPYMFQLPAMMHIDAFPLKYIQILYARLQ